MSDCVLESATGASEREALYAMLRESGSKANPVITQFCQFHGLPHVVETPEDLSRRREVYVPAEALKPIKFMDKPYCEDCASYHNGACSSPGRAVGLGTHDWGKRRISI